MKNNVAAVAVTALVLSGCAGLSDSEQRMLTGTAGGTAAGAAIGAIAGNAALGAGIGAAAGLAGGWLWNQHKEAEQQAFDRGVAAGERQAGS